MAKQKIVGIFAQEQEAILAIKRLKRDGYKDDEISVMAKDSGEMKRVKEATDADTHTTDVKAGAVGGAVTGGVLGGVGALLLELGVVAIPGVGPFLAAGPIVVTLTGIVAGGAVGGIAGALIDAGLTKEEADEYEVYLERGDILVMVDEHPDRDVERNFYENNSVIKDKYDKSNFTDGPRTKNDPTIPGTKNDSAGSKDIRY